MDQARRAHGTINRCECFDKLKLIGEITPVSVPTSILLVKLTQYTCANVSTEAKVFGGKPHLSVIVFQGKVNDPNLYSFVWFIIFVSSAINFKLGSLLLYLSYVEYNNIMT